MREVIAELQAELKKARRGTLQPASEKDIQQAELFGFPAVLIDFYREGAPQAAEGVVQLGQRIWSVQNAIAENRDYVPGADLFPLGYVVFASTQCGDAYCVDTVHADSSGEYPIVLFPHDSIQEGASLEDVERYRLTVATSLEGFLQQFARRALIETPKYR